MKPVAQFCWMCDECSLRIGLGVIDHPPSLLIRCMLCHEQLRDQLARLDKDALADKEFGDRWFAAHSMVILNPDL